MRIPAYDKDRKILVQVTEIIVNGKKIIKQIPLQAYQTIHTPTSVQSKKH